MSDLVVVVSAIGLGRLALALALECAGLYLGLRLMLSCIPTVNDRTHRRSQPAFTRSRKVP